jgi:hypothetical protein
VGAGQVLRAWWGHHCLLVVYPYTVYTLAYTIYTLAYTVYTLARTFYTLARTIYTLAYSVYTHYEQTVRERMPRPCHMAPRTS